MQISDIIVPAAIRVTGALATKKRLFQDLAEVGSQVYGLSTEAAFDAMQERESLSATGVGHGVALPHARLEGLDRVVGVFMRIEKPMDFDSIDRLPVDLVFALFAPVESGVDHLKALAMVSRLLRSSETCATLRANVDQQALYAVLTDRQRDKAA
jgi:PTS system nitrogen regulatory IIA component